MTQTARPKADLSNSGWSPTPLWKQILQQTPNDSPRIQSAGSSGGDTFSVQLTPLAYPLPGSEQLTLRWALAQAGSLPVTVKLLQGGSTIAQRVLKVSSTAFATQVIPLTANEIANISNYGQLSVQVSTALPPITRRGLGTAALSNAGQTLTLGNVTVFAGEMLIVGVGGSDVGVSGVTFKGTSLQSAVTANNPSVCRAGIYCLAVNSDTTGDIVVQWSAQAAAGALEATAVAALPQGALDKEAGSSGTGTTISTGSLTTQATQAYLHAIAFLLVPNQQGSSGLSWQSPFSQGQVQLLSNQTPGGLWEGWCTISAAGSYSASGTTQTSVQWAAVLASFR